MQTQPTTILASFTTDSLVCLAVALDAVRDGLITAGTSEYLELVDTNLLATLRENIRPTNDAEIGEAIQGELIARHHEIAAALQAWSSWTHRHTSWSAALLEAADVVRKQEHNRLDRLGAVTAFTYFMNP